MRDSIFQVEDVLELEYVEGQRLNSVLNICNLTDQTINFHIRTVKPELYPVVKPSSGIIYGRDIQRVTISRRSLSREEYEAYRENPNISSVDMFQVICTLQYADSFGKVQNREESKKIPVKFKRRTSLIPADTIQQVSSMRESSVSRADSIDPTRDAYEKMVKNNDEMEQQNLKLLSHIKQAQEKMKQPVITFDKTEIILLSGFTALLALGLSV